MLEVDDDLFTRVRFREPDDLLEAGGQPNGDERVLQVDGELGRGLARELLAGLLGVHHLVLGHAQAHVQIPDSAVELAGEVLALCLREPACPARVAFRDPDLRRVEARDRGEFALPFGVDLERTGVVGPRNHDLGQLRVGTLCVQFAHPVRSGRDDGQGCGDQKHEVKLALASRPRRRCCRIVTNARDTYGHSPVSLTATSIPRQIVG